MQLARLPAAEQCAVEVGAFLFDTFAREVKFGGADISVINGERAYRYIWEALSEGAVWVVRDGTGIVGSISLMPRVLWWTDTEFWGDGWFYVRPDRRTSKAAFTLLRAAETFARETEKPLSICVWHADEVERKDRFLRRLGYTALGGLYVKDVC